MARFLVVDDHLSTVSALTVLLGRDGHEVHAFTAGADAVAALSRGSFGAVVTDLEMPQVDGHAVLQAARDRSPEACLVVVTGRARETEESLTAAGACMVCDKPFDYANVMKNITECHAAGGRAAHGRCHLRSRTHGHGLVELRRK